MEMTVKQMKALTEKRGSHYFSPETIRHWGSRIVSPANEHQFFVEECDDFYKTKKLFAVKCIAIDGRITTVKAAGNDADSMLSEQSALKFRDDICNIITDEFTDVKECSITKQEGVYLIRNTVGGTARLDLNKMVFTIIK